MAREQRVTLFSPLFLQPGTIVIGHTIERLSDQAIEWSNESVPCEQWARAASEQCQASERHGPHGEQRSSKEHPDQTRLILSMEVYAFPWNNINFNTMKYHEFHTWNTMNFIHEIPWISYIKYHEFHTWNTNNFLHAIGLISLFCWNHYGFNQTVSGKLGSGLTSRQPPG